MPQGRVTTYDLTVGVPVDISDMVGQLDPFDVPLLGTYGADGRSTLSKGSCTQKKVEWLDDTLLAPRDTLGEALDDSETGVDIDTANAFGVGDVILIDAEYMRVTAVNAAGTTLTVTRGYNSSTAAAHDDNSVVVGVGLALAEGSDPEVFRSVDRSARYNMTQIYGPHQISMSGTEMVIPKYGVASEWSYQLGKLVKQVAISQEQSLLYGTRQEDTSGEIRTAGGISYYITTNVDSSTTTITEAKLLDQMQAVFNAGGSIDRLVVGAKTKRVISAWATGLTVNVNRGEATRGQVVEQFISDFGAASVHLNRWVRTADAFGFSRDQATVKTLRPLQIEKLAKTGDSEKAQVLCEATLQFERERHAFKFTALT
jgi:hypothetical protein